MKRLIISFILIQGSLNSMNVCDTNLIYNADFQYSLPRPILEGFLSGKAFDNRDVYTSDEAARLQSDINDLYLSIMAQNPVKEPFAIITAGAPGAGKTIKLRQELEEFASQGREYAYICPDDVCLKRQTRTHVADLKNSDDSKDARQKAYNKWRPGSNAATHLILGNLIREKYAFYYGTTSSSPATGIFFEYLKKQGYQIKLLHVSAPDDVRWASIQERDKTFVQTTEQDIREKGLLLPQRIDDTFLKYADTIEFYHRGSVHADAVLAARWTHGNLEIIARDQYEQIKAIHNEAVRALNKSELTWEATVEKSAR